MSEPTGASWEHERYCAAITAEITRLAEVARGADLATPVRTCPGWALAKLIRHLGITHRWAGQIVHGRLTERLASRDVEAGLPDSDDGYVAWLAAGAAPLVSALREAGPDTKVWTWAPGGTAHWWARRMFHETIVHRADVEDALGRTPSIDPRAAADGISEFLTILTPTISERLRELPRDGQTIHLHATDAADGHQGDAAGGPGHGAGSPPSRTPAEVPAGEPGTGPAAAPSEWMVTLNADAITWEGRHGKGTVAVRGPAADLLLLTYGRLKPSGGHVEVFGDRDLLERWLRASAF